MSEQLQAQALLEAYLAETASYSRFMPVQLKNLAACRAILEADPAVQLALLLEMLQLPSNRTRATASCQALARARSRWRALESTL